MGSSPTGPTAFDRRVAQWQSTVTSLVTPSSIAFCFFPIRITPAECIRLPEWSTWLPRVRPRPAPFSRNLDTGPDPVTFVCVCRREELCTNTSSSVFDHKRMRLTGALVRQAGSRGKVPTRLPAWSTSTTDAREVGASQYQTVRRLCAKLRRVIFYVGGKDGKQESIFKHH